MKPPFQHSLIAISSLLTIGLLPDNMVPAAFAQQALPPMTNSGLLVPSTGNAVTQPSYYEQQPASIQETQTFNVPQQPAIVQVDSDTFQVNSIEVQGNKILSDDEVRRIVAPFEGRQLNPEELASIVAKINEEYRNRGFLTSLAFIPPQDLERGAITIKVLEGMIGDMEIQGNKYFRARAIARTIDQNPGEPLNIPQLEKDLVRINRTEPFKLRATLSPGEKTGETKVHLDVLEQKPLQIALTTDNMGRSYIGNYRWGAEVTHRNLTGWGDRLSARYIGSTGSQIASASYTMPLNGHGTEVSALFGFSHVDVDLDVRNQPEIVGNTYNYGLLLSQPLNRERSLVADLGLNARRASSFFDGDKTSADDVRSLSLGVNYNKYDRYGRTFARMQGTFAPDWLGANTSFIKMENFFTRVTKLPKNNLLLLSAYTQWTPDDLPPIEQFQLGGQNSVRGYSQGLLIGDRGYSINAEWRWPVPFLRAASPWLADRVQGAFFVDHGQTWLDRSNRNFVAGISNRRNRQSLISAGFGVRAHLTDYMQGFLDVAFGLVDREDVEPKSQPTARIHFGVRSELLPNDYKARNDVVTPIKTDVFRPRSVGTLRENDLQSEISDPTLEPMDGVMRKRVY